MRNLIFLTIFSLIFGLFGGFFSFYLLYYFKLFPYFPAEQITIKKEIKIEEKKKVLEEAIEKVEKNVFLIKTKEKEGCGFVLTSDGLGITLAQNLKFSKKSSQKDEISFFLEGEKIEGEIIKIDQKQNLALVKLNKGNFPVFPFADPEKVKLGTAIFLVGKIFKEKDKGKIKTIVEEGIIKSIDEGFFEMNVEGEEKILGCPVFDFETKFLGIVFEKNKKIFILPASKIKIFANL